MMRTDTYSARHDKVSLGQRKEVQEMLFELEAEVVTSDVTGTWYIADAQVLDIH
jgi:hypothetical protein